MHEPLRPIFCFEGFCLDLGRGRLVDPRGAEVGLRPKSFDVLHHFVEAAGRLVSRDELMEAIWPGVVVIDENITQCVAEIRRALGQEGSRLLRTVPKRGYIFTAEVSRLSANTLDAGGRPLESHRISFDTEEGDRPTDNRPLNGPSKGWRDRVERRLAAILVADVVGSSRLIEADEAYALAAIRAVLHDVLIATAAQHGGRLIKTMGDGALLEFASSVSAVTCAVEVQKVLADRATSEPEDRRVLLRIGVNLGDIVAHPEGDLYGDGVNVAVRLEGIADPGGIVISAKVHDELQGKLALSFEDRGEQQVKNIARPVRVYALTGAAPSRSEPKALPLPDKPSIAVLPFANMSGDPDQGHVADGVVEEIIAALSRVRSFFVISRNSTFTYKGRSVDPRQVSRELGVRYVVEGSVRKSGRRLRIVAQLIDATTGNHVWGERYEGDASDIFDLQDRVTEAVVGALEPSITVNEIARARSKRPESLTAYDLVMRALPAIWSQDSETTQGGLRLAEQAIELDPSYALPRAVAAWCYAQRLSYLRTKNLSEDRAKAVTLAQEAARIDDNDPLVLTCAGAAYSIAREYPRAQALIQKALALDPNSAWAWHRSGWLHAYIREPDTAIQHFERAMRLSPLDPLTFNVFIGIGAAHFEKKEYDAAAGWIEKGLREKPDALWAYRLLSASYFYARRTDEARRTFAAFAETFPGLTVSSLLDPTPWSDSIKAKFGEAFRALGLPE